MDRRSVSAEMETLARGICRCRKCRLHEGRTHAVPGEGDLSAKIILIGEAPGEAEDRTGRPFMGRSGAFLDEMLSEAGLQREALFITSSVKCRPPENRNPRVDELEICREVWLARQIEAVSPSCVVLLGKTAVRSVLADDARLADVHGQTRRRGSRRFLLTYHPTAAMRFPEAGRGFRADLRKLKRL